MIGSNHYLSYLGKGVGEAFTLFAQAVPPPPAWLASVVVSPYHVAQKLEHLFIKDNNGTNIFTVKFCLHFTQKYYPVPVPCAYHAKLHPHIFISPQIKDSKGLNFIISHFFVAPPLLGSVLSCDNISIMQNSAAAHLKTVVTIIALLCLSRQSPKKDTIVSTNVQKLDVPGPDEKFCLCWLCAVTKFSSGGAIFPVHLIFEHL